MRVFFCLIFAVENPIAALIFGIKLHHIAAGFIKGGFPGNFMTFTRPLSKINQATTITAERAMWTFFSPDYISFTGWAFYGERLFRHRLLSVDSAGPI